MENYDLKVRIYLTKVKDKNVRADVIDLLNYLDKGFAQELALSDRNYKLGLSNTNDKKAILIKAYNYENKLRAYLSLDPLPEIDLSII